MATVVVTRNFQVTIPKDLREELNIRIGDRLVGRIEEDEIVIKKMNDNPVDKAFGIWKGKLSGSSADILDDMRKRWRK